MYRLRELLHFLLELPELLTQADRAQARAWMKVNRTLSFLYFLLRFDTFERFLVLICDLVLTTSVSISNLLQFAVYGPLVKNFTPL